MYFCVGAVGGGVEWHCSSQRTLSALGVDHVGYSSEPEDFMFLVVSDCRRCVAISLSAAASKDNTVNVLQLRQS